MDKVMMRSIALQQQPCTMFLFEKRVSDDYVDPLVRGGISVRVMIAITLPIAQLFCLPPFNSYILGT